MHVRAYKPSDLARIAQLYFDTVRRINSADYNPAQIAAWAPRVYRNSFWSSRFRHYAVFVVEHNGEVIGFAEFGADGHIDCFYVHHQWQQRGVGRKLMLHILRQARQRRLTRVYADVSLTARAFFARMGFRTVRPQTRIYHGQRFSQFQMQRHMR